MCYQAAPGPSRLHNVVVVSVAGQLAHRCPLRELYVQLLEPLSHLFEAKTIDEYSEDDAPANIDTERPHAHCTGAATVRGRRMKKNSARKRAPQGRGRTYRGSKGGVIQKTARMAARCSSPHGSSCLRALLRLHSRDDQRATSVVLRRSSSCLFDGRKCRRKGMPSTSGR
jgi:hypothetical protein